MRGKKLLQITKKVCARVRPSWRKDFEQRLFLVMWPKRKGRTEAEVATYMRRRLKDLYRKEHNYRKRLEPIPQNLPGVVLPQSSLQTQDDLARLFLSAKSFDRISQRFLANWIDEVLERKHGAITRAAKRTSISLGRAKTILRTWRASIQLTEADGTVVENTYDLEQKLRRRKP